MGKNTFCRYIVLILRQWRENTLFSPVLQLHKFQVMGHLDWALDGLHTLEFQFLFQVQDVLALSFLGLVWLVPWRICLPGRSIRPQASKIGCLGTLPGPSSFSRVRSKQALSLFPFVPPPGSNGSVVVLYAKESSKQLAAGIVTLGDVGYKNISKYCADFVPNGNGIVKQRSSGYKANGATNGHLIDSE